ncbi:hypothetical protein NL676_021942 [Syzygium grande]|nr:hypothetical protein NL676_021942 [Syzygium grande]
MRGMPSEVSSCISVKNRQKFVQILSYLRRIYAPGPMKDRFSLFRRRKLSGMKIHRIESRKTRAARPNGQCFRPFEAGLKFEQAALFHEHPPSRHIFLWKVN